MYKLKHFMCISFTCLVATNISAVEPRTTHQEFNDVSNYISAHWRMLIRDITKCTTFNDVKMKGKSSLYFPANYTVPEEIKKIQSACSIHIARLPSDIVKQVRHGKLNDENGLLYLPHPYVVPGGMFNEMYGWDSYFIIRGLVEDNQIELAKGMVENFFFEIEYYGSILNGNRVYYLSRSQPPFLSSMVLTVYRAEKESLQTSKIKWLQKAYAYIIKDYQLWTNPPHLAGNTGLSRYFDFRTGPVIETGDEINFYYRDAVKYFLLHPDAALGYLVNKNDTALTKTGDKRILYTINICDSITPISSKTCHKLGEVSLTDKFYRGDRATRESGMDISFRFGAYGSGTIDYAPLDLNNLLYKTERDLEEISKILKMKKQATYWHNKASARKAKINQYFWNKKKGMFYDFNTVKNEQSNYDYITTFYPLWTGLATPEQALAIKNNLNIFEQKGGLLTSTCQSGAQWDSPFGWAPFHLIAIEGLRNYGYHKDADRISIKFLTNISENFYRDGTIREKYNVITSTSETKIKVGYVSNEIGFGWTNGVFLALLHQLDKDGSI